VNLLTKDRFAGYEVAVFATEKDERFSGLIASEIQHLSDDNLVVASVMNIPDTALKPRDYTLQHRLSAAPTMPVDITPFVRAAPCEDSTDVALIGCQYVDTEGVCVANRGKAARRFAD
jgi:hypothetical protein